MAGEARTLGARVVALEEELDRLFAAGTAETARLAALASSIGALDGRLREVVHLAAHIAMRGRSTLSSARPTRGCGATPQRVEGAVARDGWGCDGAGRGRAASDRR